MSGYDGTIKRVEQLIERLELQPSDDAYLLAVVASLELGSLHDRLDEIRATLDSLETHAG